MPHSVSSQAFAFTALSPSSQLNLAARMSTRALIDFASESSAFRNFLLSRAKVIVIEALRVQYGIIAHTANWDHCGPPPSLVHSRDRKLNWMSEVPVLQRLRDEELGGESVGRLLQLLGGTEQDYGVGVRGLVKCALKYNSLRNSCGGFDASRKIGDWLRSSYTNWGIMEMVEVHNKLKEAIEEVLGLQRLEERVKSLMIDRLLCGMDILKIWSARGKTCFEDLVRLGIVEMIKPKGGWELIRRKPLRFRNWRVCDEECAGWFIRPAEYALSCINEPLGDISFSVSTGSADEFDAEGWEDESGSPGYPPRILGPSISAKGGIRRAQYTESPPAHAPQTTATIGVGRAYVKLRDPWNFRSPIRKFQIGAY
ncbi:hypothetical protein B9Z19DRAFT_1193061 [Tuber borchii]|uniref:Uncharacterized protein n=1 Tax=Tuber borchii TaxID=42251 RepID=A0A2T6ZU02_TUBBO|nr:hypothetical protein B9Z19DRAFT_1193061 [Tuber borchii]